MLLLLIVGVVGSAEALRRSHASLRDWAGTQLRAPRFQLRAVDFFGLQALAAPTLVRRAELRARVPLIDLDLDGIRSRLAAHPRIARCVAALKPPGRLLVEIQERVPIARLEPNGEGISSDGSVFPLLPGERERLPSVTGRAEWALPSLRAARELGIELETLTVKAREDVWLRPIRRTIRLRVGSTAEPELRRWLRVRDSALLRRHAPREVDLRFEGSVVLRGSRKSRGGRTDGSS